ncbi:MAG: VWA domain-containing protein [Pseudomonadota bacterium]
MSFLGSKSEGFCMMQLRSYILISALSIPVLVLSLVPPAWGSESKRDIVLVIDNSGSMKKNDPEFLARHALKTFISESVDNTHLALITFDQNVNLTVPLTSLSAASRPILLDAIQEIDYSGSLTNSPAAIERAIYEIALHGRDDADKSIIFITDGIVDTGNKTRDKQQEDWMLEELSTLASNLDIRIFGIAFAEAANYQLIQDLVVKTGGDHFRVLLAEDLPSVFARLEELYRPATTLSPQESQPPKVMLDTQPPSDLKGETQIVGNNETLPETIKNEVLNEITDAKDPLNGPESLAQSKSDSMPNKLLNKVQRLYASTDKRALVISALFICLVALGAFFVSRRKNTPHRRKKSVPRRLRPRPVHNSSVKDNQEKALLIDINHFTSRRNHPLAKSITKIGRVNTGKHNDSIQHLLIDKPTIGREHALIEYEDDGYWLVDRDSTNGTFIDGRRVRGRALLKNGNRIRFHDIEFIFSIPSLNKFEKTVSVPIAGSREESEQDKNAFFTNGPENRHSPLVPSEATKNISKSHININSNNRSQDETWLQLAKEDEEYKKSFKNAGLQKRTVSDDTKENRPARPTSNRAGTKPTSKITPEVKSRSRNKGDTEVLSVTKPPPFSSTDEGTQESRQTGIEKTQVMPPPQIKESATRPIEPIEEDTLDPDVTQLSPTINTEERARESRQEDIEKTQLMSPSQTKGSTTEPIEEDAPDPDVTQLSPTINTEKRARESRQEDIEKSPSPIWKKTTGPMEPNREDTLDLDITQPPPISDLEKHAPELKKSDTEKIPQDVLEQLFKSEQSKDNST